MMEFQESISLRHRRTRCVLFGVFRFIVCNRIHEDKPRSRGYWILECFSFWFYSESIDRWPSGVWFSAFTRHEYFKDPTVGWRVVSLADQSVEQSSAFTTFLTFSLWFVYKQTFIDFHLLSFILVSASYVPGPIPDSTRSRHAPLYGRLVSEEHLPASHRDVHQVSARHW